MADCLKDRIHPTNTFNMLLDTGDTAVNRTESRLLFNGMGQRRLSNKMRFEQRPEGSEGASQAVIREVSSKCKGPEVCSQIVTAVSADGAEVRG